MPRSITLWTTVPKPTVRADRGRTTADPSTLRRSGSHSQASVCAQTSHAGRDHDPTDPDCAARARGALSGHSPLPRRPKVGLDGQRRPRQPRRRTDDASSRLRPGQAGVFTGDTSSSQSPPGGDLDAHRRYATNPRTPHIGTHRRNSATSPQRGRIVGPDTLVNYDTLRGARRDFHPHVLHAVQRCTGGDRPRLPLWRQALA